MSLAPRPRSPTRSPSTFRAPWKSGSRSTTRTERWSGAARVVGGRHGPGRFVNLRSIGPGRCDGRGACGDYRVYMRAGDGFLLQRRDPLIETRRAFVPALILVRVAPSRPGAARRRTGDGPLPRRPTRGWWIPPPFAADAGGGRPRRSGTHPAARPRDVPGPIRPGGPGSLRIRRGPVQGFLTSCTASRIAAG